MTMTLKEIYQALLDGKTLINNQTNEKVCLAENTLIGENGEDVASCFGFPEDWEIYKDLKDPKNWIGKLCWFWDEIETEKVLRVLLEYKEGSSYPFSANPINYKHCRLATKEEVEQYLVKEN